MERFEVTTQGGQIAEVSDTADAILTGRFGFLEDLIAVSATVTKGPPEERAGAGVSRVARVTVID